MAPSSAEMRQRLANLVEGARRRTHSFDLGSFPADGEALDYLYVRDQLLVAVPDLAAVLSAIRALGVVVVERDRPIADLARVDVVGPPGSDWTVPTILAELDKLLPGARVSPCHVAVLSAKVVPGPGVAQQPAKADRGRDDADSARVIVLSALLEHIVQASDPTADVSVHEVFGGFVADEVELTQALVEILTAKACDIVLVPGGFYARGDRRPLTLDAIESAMAADGPIVVAAAGDDESTRPFFPAAIVGTRAVAALDREGRPAEWSNYGASVDVWATGDDILPLTQANFPAIANVVAPSFAVWSGTSFAAAIVTGALAKGISRLSTPSEAWELLLDRATARPGLGRVVEPATAGLIAAPAADPSLGFDFNRGPSYGGDGVYIEEDDDDRGLIGAPLWPRDSEEIREPAPDPDEPPTREVSPRIDAPDEVVAGREFEVIIGLAPAPVEGVAGGPFRIPDSAELPLDVHLIVEGFQLRKGETWRNRIDITPEDRFPTVTVHLTADSPDRMVRAGMLQVSFSMAGAPLAWATRSIAVVAESWLLGSSGIRPQSPEGVIEVARHHSDVDLTVNIALGEVPGRLIWTFESPHLEPPDKPVSVDLGGSPADFTSPLVRQIKQREGRPDMAAFLRGKGRTIADKMPAVFWKLLAEVAKVAKLATDGPPTVLLQSEDPFVPWELALVDPVLDEHRPPFLGCQAVVGRWVLTRTTVSQRPPETAAANTMAVISGIYDSPRWVRLKAAEAEAAELRKSYLAVPVDARLDTVLECLSQDPVPEVVHFAGHGSRDDSGIENGLVMIDGTTLDPTVVLGIELKGKPVVFLNACQVGGGQQQLGSYAGMAAAFLRQGATAVIAPLWDVNDTVAKDLVLAFYQKAFSGSPPAAIVRDLRGRVAGIAGAFGSGAPVATALAYQYFGHPGLTLSRR